MVGLAPVHWTVAGRPVILSDWSANSSAGAGFDQMRGSISAADAQIMPQSIMQGSIISGWSEYGRVVFEGRLAATPKIDQSGAASIVAQGRVAEAAKRQSRLLFYTTNATVFQDSSKPPFNRITYPDPTSIVFTPTASEADQFSTIVGTQGKGSLHVSGASLTAGMAVEAILFIPGARIRRLRAYVDQSTGLKSVKISTTDSALGPAVLVVDRTTSDAGDSFAAGSTGWIDVQLPGQGTPGLVVGFAHNAGTVGATLYALELWGEQFGDIIYSEQAASSIATRLGWDDSGVEAVGGTDIRPLDWQGPWDQMIGYAAGIDGACWGVYEDERGYGPRLDYGNYGRRTWQVSSAGATWDLSPLEITNRAVIAYVSEDGRDNQIILDANPDPLASVGLTNEIRANMNDRQGDFDLATRYGTSILAQGSKQLYAGRVSCVSATDTKTGLDAPYEIRGGDLLTIVDFNGTEALTVRVSDVEYAPGLVTIGVEEPAVAMSASGSGVTTPGPVGGGGLADVSGAVQARNSQPTVSYFEAANNMWAVWNKIAKKYGNLWKQDM